MVLHRGVGDVVELQHLVGFNANFVSCGQLQEAEVTFCELICGRNNNVSDCANRCSICSYTISCGGLGLCPETSGLAVCTTASSSDICTISVNTNSTIGEAVNEGLSILGDTKAFFDS